MAQNGDHPKTKDDKAAEATGDELLLLPWDEEDQMLAVGRAPCTLDNCGHMRQLDAIVTFLAMPRGGVSVLDFLRRHCVGVACGGQTESAAVFATVDEERARMGKARDLLEAVLRGEDVLTDRQWLRSAKRIVAGP